MIGVGLEVGVLATDFFRVFVILLWGECRVPKRQPKVAHCSTFMAEAWQRRRPVQISEKIFKCFFLNVKMRRDTSPLFRGRARPFVNRGLD